ncbi:MAG: AMP-binding protein [Acidimicrobiia bacterium]
MDRIDWTVHLPPGSDPAALDLLAAGSLPRAWAATLGADPARPVLWEEHRGWVSAGDLDAASRRVAGRFHRAGLRPGMRVLMSASTSVELVEAHLGALRLGLVVVPANRAYRQPEMAHLVDDAEPAAAVVDDAERAGWISEASAGTTLVAGPEVALPDPPPGHQRGMELDAAESADPALIAYTSGTTGRPKGAVLSHANLLATAEAVRLAWRWRASDRLVLALPLFHLHGLGVGLHGTLLAGASALLLPRFDAGAVVGATRSHHATMFFGVPTMYARLAALATEAPEAAAALGRLRLCVSGSAPLPPAVFDQFEAATGQRVLERYGMSETGMNVSNPHDGERRPGTVGLPLPGVEVRLAPGTGEIFLRGPNVSGGYWRDPEATEAAFTADGWFRSGDVGAHDPDGYLRIVGRAKELIITGGLNVYPREVEDAILACPGVAEAAVVGRADPEWGEVVTAFVVRRGRARPTEGEILAHTAGVLAGFKRPRAVHFVDSLPRNPLGKLLRHELG